MGAKEQSNGDTSPQGCPFEQRLRRASSVPSSQRSPEVAAFVQSTALCREACSLLPLLPSGQAALPCAAAAADARQQVLRAFSFYAHAAYLCPQQPACVCPVSNHLQAYLAWWPAQADGTIGAGIDLPSNSKNGSSPAASGGKTSSFDLLWSALSTLARTCTNSDPAALPAVLQLAAELAAKLSDHSVQLQLSVELAQLAGSVQQQQQQPQQQAGTAEGKQLHVAQQLSVEQLQYVLDWQLVLLAATLQEQQQAQDAAHKGGGTGQAGPMQAPTQQAFAASQQQLEIASREGAAGAARLLQLEPASPRSHFAAGLSALHSPAGGASDGQLAAVQHFLRAAELGRQQGSDYWAARGAAAAVQHAHWLLPSRASSAAAKHQQQQQLWSSTAQAGLAAFEMAQPAAQRCAQLLPEAWERELAGGVARAEQQACGMRVALQGSPTGKGAGAGACKSAGASGFPAAVDDSYVLPHNRAAPPSAAAQEAAMRRDFCAIACLDACCIALLTACLGGWDCCAECCAPCCEECCNSCCST